MPRGEVILSDWYQELKLSPNDEIRASNFSANRSRWENMRAYRGESRQPESAFNFIPSHFRSSLGKS